VGNVTPRRGIGRVFVGVVSTSMSSVSARRSSGSTELTESNDVEGEGEGEGSMPLRREKREAGPVWSARSPTNTKTGD
jgi:hypothetical protein